MIAEAQRETRQRKAEDKREAGGATPGSNPHRVLGKGRVKVGELNQTEQRYYDEVLYPRMIAGEILWAKFEGFKLRLADGCFYSPDFIVMLKDGSLEAHEVKGYWEDTARVKIKVAAAMYPLRFIAISKATKANGGAWKTEEF